MNAIKEYIRAADRLPANDEAQLKVAQGLLLAGRFEEVRTRADKVRGHDARNAKAQIRRLDEAKQQFERVVAQNPKSVPAQTKVGMILEAQGKLDEALQLAQTAAEQLHDEPAVNDTFGWIVVKKDLAAKAIPYLESAAKGDSSVAAGLKMQPTSDLAADARKTLEIIGGSPSRQ